MVVALAATLTTSVAAQTLRSSYFLEGSVLRHEINPAFMGERNYVSMPFLGGLNIGVQSNVGLSNFVYKLNDPTSKYKLTSFMHPNISSSEFLNGLHEKNTLNLNLSMPVISFGFHKWGGFNTFGINLRVNSNVNMPKDLFVLMKNMQDQEITHYNVKDMTVRANAYAEVALGHSRQIDDNLTVGGKLKILLGVGNANAHVDNMDITMSQDKWTVAMSAKGDISLKGSAFETKAVEGSDRREIDGFNLDTFSPIGGIGMGIDLGAVYKMDDFVEGLTLSASVLDLGFISWKHTIKAANDGSTPFEFAGFDNIVVDDDDDPNSLSNQFDRIGDDLEDMIKFYDGGIASKRTTALNATLNIGAEYALPWYKKLTFGFLSSTHFNKPFTWTEGRFYANVAPIKWFDASVNYAASTYGSSFGWILNFHPKGFNFFIGSDHMIFKVNPQFVPVHNLNANINLGINFTFGNGPKKKIFASK